MYTLLVEGHGREPSIVAGERDVEVDLRPDRKPKDAIAGNQHVEVVRRQVGADLLRAERLAAA